MQREPVTAPPAVVVPADRVVEKCPCGEDEEADDCTRKPVEYVHVTAWQSPPSARRVEEHVAAQPAVGAGGGRIVMPKLTMHQGIPEGRAWRLGRFRY